MQVKCDKHRPVCGRCSRIGFNCNPQLRGRGRPPGKAEVKDVIPACIVGSSKRPTSEPKRARQKILRAAQSSSSARSNSRPDGAEFVVERSTAWAIVPLAHEDSVASGRSEIETDGKSLHVVSFEVCVDAKKGHSSAEMDGVLILASLAQRIMAES